MAAEPARVARASPTTPQRHSGCTGRSMWTRSSTRSTASSPGTRSCGRPTTSSTTSRCRSSLRRGRPSCGSSISATCRRSEQEVELLQLLHAESEHPFDLRVDSVLRPFLIRLGDGRPRLLQRHAPHRDRRLVARRAPRRPDRALRGGARAAGAAATAAEDPVRRLRPVAPALARRGRARAAARPLEGGAPRRAVAARAADRQGAARPCAPTKATTRAGWSPWRSGSGSKRSRGPATPRCSWRS